MFSAVFVFQFFPLLKVSKNSGKIYRISAFQKLPYARRRARGPPPGAQAPWWRGQGPTRAGWLPRHPGHRLGSPMVPIYSPVTETLIPEPFSPEAILISAAIADKLRGTIIPVPAPCRDGEVPSASSPSTLLPPSMKRE